MWIQIQIQSQCSEQQCSTGIGTECFQTMKQKRCTNHLECGMIELTQT